MQDHIIKALRWLARFISALVLIIVFMLALGEGLPSPGDLTSSELFMFFGLLTMIAGYIVVWFKEYIGALIILAGFLVFWILNSFSMNWFIAMFPISGLLFLYCSKNDKGNTAA